MWAEPATPWFWFWTSDLSGSGGEPGCVEGGWLVVLSVSLGVSIVTEGGEERQDTELRS